MSLTLAFDSTRASKSEIIFYVMGVTCNGCVNTTMQFIVKNHPAAEVILTLKRVTYLADSTAKYIEGKVRGASDSFIEKLNKDYQEAEYDTLSASLDRVPLGAEPSRDKIIGDPITFKPKTADEAEPSRKRPRS